MAGLTQVELGKKLGVNHSQITHIEAGRRSLPLKHAKTIVKILHIPKEALVKAYALDFSDKVSSKL